MVSAGLFLWNSQAWAQMEDFDVQSSVILEAEGHACMGEDKSRKETRELAMAETKRKAAEMALTHIKSETEVKNAIVSSDIINAYAQAKVRVIEEMEKGWFKTEYAVHLWDWRVLPFMLLLLSSESWTSFHLKVSTWFRPVRWKLG